MKFWLNPKWRVWLLLSTANLAWIICAWLIVERETWLWIIPIALSINFILLTYDQVFQFRALDGQPLVGQDAWGILKSVNVLSEQLHVTPPQVFLLPWPSAQVFSYAKMASHSRLFVTQGLVDLLTPRQLRAALTFQLITIRSSYNILNYWVAAVLDLVYHCGRGVERVGVVIFGWAPPVAKWSVYPWIWLLHGFLLGAKDFALLDTQTARAIENPEDLAQVLWKLDAYAHTRPWTESWIFAHMCMVSPLHQRHLPGGLRVQPALHGRIMSLIGRFPL